MCYIWKLIRVIGNSEKNMELINDKKLVEVHYQSLLRSYRMVAFHSVWTRWGVDSIKQEIFEKEGVVIIKSFQGRWRWLMHFMVVINYQIF